MRTNPMKIHAVAVGYTENTNNQKPLCHKHNNTEQYQVKRVDEPSYLSHQVD